MDSFDYQYHYYLTIVTGLLPFCSHSAFYSRSYENLEACLQHKLRLIDFTLELSAVVYRRYRGSIPINQCLGSI